MSSAIDDAKIKELIIRYGIEENLPEVFDWLVALRFLIEYLRDDIRRDDSDMEDFFKVHEVALSPHKITEIQIIKGGIPYTFKNDEVLLEQVNKLFIDLGAPKTPKSLAEIKLEAQEFLFYHDVETLRPLFNKLTFLSERKRYLLIHEMYQLADYPFDKQQLNANDQAKASLIKNWFKRSEQSKMPRNKKSKNSR